MVIYAIFCILGDTNGNEETDTIGIFEPGKEGATFQGKMEYQSIVS
jgi:hypothetical protein